MLRHIRFHGRGAEGVELVSRIVSRAALLCGFAVQGSPVYGAARRSAPVVAFASFGDGPICEGGYIDNPHMVVVMDESLLVAAEAAVVNGVDESTLVAVNTQRAAADLRAQTKMAGRLIVLDVSSIALETDHECVPSAPIAAVTVKAGAIAGWEALNEAVRIELGRLGVERGLIEHSIDATRRAFDKAPTLGLQARQRGAPVRAAEPFVIQRSPLPIVVPYMSTKGSAAVRSMEDWHVYRPEINRPRCSRCFSCFALCPEGAVHLDAEEYPVIEYRQCKGCLLCASECPSNAIDQVREAAA